MDNMNNGGFNAQGGFQPADTIPAYAQTTVQSLGDKPIKKKNPSTKWHIIYLCIIGVLILGGVGGFFYLNHVYNQRYIEATAVQKTEYETAKAQYDAEYAKVLEEEAQWQQTLKNTQDELNSVNAELKEVYDERQAKIDAEIQRWNALTEEEQSAEITANKYNEMVSYLRSNDEEYAQLYVQFAQYLDKDIFNLGKEESLIYTELHNRMVEIEEAYRASH